MKSLISRFRSFSLSILLFTAFFPMLRASDIIQLSPLTNNIILIVFDDGIVNYPDDLQVDRLLIADASNVSSYSISSIDDSDFGAGTNPFQIGRKSKGTEFVKNAPWGGNSYDPRTKPWASRHFIYLFLDKEMKSANTYTINTSALAANGSEWTFVFEEKNLRSEAVHVNTIGYETNAPKYGYVYQWMGDRGGLDLSAYNGNTYHVFKEGVTDPVLSGILKKRKPATNAETGQLYDTPDKNFLGAEVYECDFSSITEDGNYTLVVDDIGSSFPFKIGKDALWEAYYTVGRSLYYQRSGIRLAPPYTDGAYIRPVNQNTKVTSDDGTDFSGKLLYSDVPFSDWTAEDGGTAKQAIKDAAIGHPLDVAGWYHDAGDWDAYYSHQRIPILLLTTYDFFPERFADGDLNLPESGNGIPDLVDEASWLIKFNYRLRKELMVKGYSDGGLGGSRVCPDVFNSEDGSAQNDKPSWQDYRRYVVTKADAFMTYLYAGQAAQFAVVLKKLGIDPTAFPVEMLDHVDYAAMTKDLVNWEQEARDAYAWASDLANQPANGNNYASELGVYQMYAATSLYRLTNEEQYHSVALTELDKVKNAAKIDDDERYGVYSYLLADNYSKDKLLNSALLNSALNNATFKGMTAADIRACRWGGVYDMPMLVGQATTPWVFEVMIAYGLTGEKTYLDVAHTTTDYFLGTNPLHTTWATGLGPRPAEAGFHLDTRYNNNWVNYPGFIPYGPWSMSYDYNEFLWTIDGVQYGGGHGPWNKDWANFSQYPFMSQWPGHERWNSNIHAPMSTENTVHQNSVYGALAYGFVNNRQNKNFTAVKSIGTITLDNTDLTISEQGGVEILTASLDIADASIAAIKWESSNELIAYVDQLGRVTGVNSGSCTISCSTLDGSVSADARVTCSWTEVAVESISIEPDSLSLVAGQTAQLKFFFSPENATNKFVDWSFSEEGIVSIDENGTLTALMQGSVFAIVTSLSGSKKDTCFVEVSEALDYIIADFDDVIPVKTAPQPDIAQIFTPGGSCETDFSNPLLTPANESAKVVKYNKPVGQWKLIGMVFPTEDIQSTDKYSQFQFKYMGSEIEEFYIQLKPVTGDNYETTVSIEGVNAWRLFTIDLNQTFDLKQFSVFVNARLDAEMTCFLDDFKLSVVPAEWYDGLSISETALELNSADEYTIASEADGHAFSWVSDNSSVATVDQNGKVTAISKGTARVRAIPLYGDAVECVVKVDGGGIEEPEVYETEILLDFESYELDWNSGYGAYAWASPAWSKIDNPSKTSINQSDKVFTWDRDGTNFGGGFGIQFPPVSAKDWARISCMVSSEAEIGSVRLAMKDGDTELGAYQTSIEMVPYSWNQLVFPLSEFVLTNNSFNRIEVQFGVGTQDVYTVYFDNVWLERGTAIPVNKLYILDASPVDIDKNDLYQLTAQVDPVNATDTELSWGSSLTSVATVSASGLLTGVGGGISSISLSLDSNPSVKASVNVKVFSGVTGIFIDGDSELSLKKDSAIQLKAIVSPADASNKEVEWLSDASDIATISGDGLLEGISAGSATIKATSVDNPAASASVSVLVSVTGIGLNQVNVLTLFPNPMHDRLTIHSGFMMDRIEIINVLGEKVFQQNIDGQSEVVLEGIRLHSGIYLLRLRTTDGNVLINNLMVE